MFLIRLPGVEIQFRIAWIAQECLKQGNDKYRMKSKQNFHTNPRGEGWHSTIQAKLGRRTEQGSGYFQHRDIFTPLWQFPSIPSIK